MTSRPVALPFLGVMFHRAPLAHLLDELLARPATAPFAYIVTPNVDHVVRLHTAREADAAEFAAAYEGAGWRICDSRVLARLARSHGLELPVVTGSDLTPALLARCESGTTIAVVGGETSLAARLGELYPGLRIRQHRPPARMRHDPQAMAEAARFAVEAAARFTFLAVGSPQQELLARMIESREGARGTGLCVGAAFDFITGAQRRAPVFMRRAGLEWLFRLAGNPRRFARRYLVEGPKIFQLWWRARPR